MVPVVIIGGGPAGAATAIALRDLAIPCVVIDDGKKTAFKPGESLAPNAGITLRRLNLDQILQTAIHGTYTGNSVVWGNDEEKSRHFFNEPNGNGWHLDRIAFEKQLRTVAENKGAIWKEGWRFSGIEYQEEKLMMSCLKADGSPIQMEVAFAVDCTGRSSSIARKLGVKKQVLDNLTAYYFLLKKPIPCLTGISFIESVEDGWWYAAPLKEHTVINFMTDSDLHDVKPAQLQEWLFQKIQNTKHLSEQLQINDLEELTEIQIKTATTSFLEEPLGFKWIAVGDALCTFDPLTSFGISLALSSSYPAALAIKGFLGGNLEAMSEYVAMQQQTFTKSVAMLKEQYRLEQRWNTSPFWQRRH